MSKLRIVKNRRYIDSRYMSHSFSLIYNYDTEGYFYRYKWCRDGDGFNRFAKEDYGERSYVSYMFNDFDQFIKTMIEDYDIDDLEFNFSLEDIHYEEFLTIEDMRI